MATYIKISEYCRRRYGADGTPPSSQTIRRWIADGRLPAIRDGRQWFVDWDAAQRLTVDDLVDSVLRAK